MKKKNTAATAISCTVAIGGNNYVVSAWANMRRGQFITRNHGMATLPIEGQDMAFESANYQLATSVNANAESILKIGKRRQAIVGETVNDTVGITYNLGLCRDGKKVAELINDKIDGHATASADLGAMRDAQIKLLADEAEAALVAEAEAEAKAKAKKTA